MATFYAKDHGYSVGDNVVTNTGIEVRVTSVVNENEFEGEAVADPALDQLHRPTDRATPMPGTDQSINENAVRNILNDGSLTDDQKAERLGITSGQYRDNIEAISADPVTILSGLRAAQAQRLETLADEPRGDPARPTFEGGGDGRRQHAILQEYEAKKQAGMTGKTPDGRKAFTPEQQALYNVYGGDVPVRNIWDWWEKLEKGVIDYDDSLPEGQAPVVQEYKRQNA